MSESKEPARRLVGEADLAPAVRHELSQDRPSVAVLREFLEERFSAETGVSVDAADEPSLHHFARWLNIQFIESPVLSKINRQGRRASVAFPTLSGKASILSQRDCPLCKPYVPAFVLPIRIRPESRQSLESARWAAFQAAIGFWLGKRQIAVEAGARYCVALTFVLDRSRRDRDLDNMVKAAQDAVTRSLSINDADVHHLDTLKVFVPKGSEEFFYLRLARTSINEHDDVILPIVSHKFAVGDALDLEDFLPQCPPDGSVICSSPRGVEADDALTQPQAPAGSPVQSYSSRPERSSPRR